MPLIIIIVLLVVMKLTEFGPLGTISWWWISGVMAIAFIWFEFIERLLGLDKKRAHEAMEKSRLDRVKKTFEGPGRSKRK